LTPQPFIIIVSGTPGTGKTTLSRLLSEALSCKHINTSQLAVQLGLARPDPTGRYTFYLDEEAFEKIVELVLEEARKKCVIVDTAYPADFLAVDEVNLSTPIIVLLRTRPDVLCERLRGRSWPREKVFENCLAEAFGEIAVTLEPYDHMVFEIDTTNVGPQEALNMLFSKIERWESGVSIDWLTDPVIAEYAVKLSASLDFDKYRLGL